MFKRSRLRELAVALALLPLAFAALGARAATFGIGANQFTIDFVPIGNPGNLDDNTGSPNPAGSVGYEFFIAKYAISRDIITTAKLNAPLAVSMESGGFWDVPVRPEMPATGISWYEAARFANWLNADEGRPLAYKFDSGGNFQLWQPGELGYNAANPYRNSLAVYWIPDVDEWYKAAFYDPNLGIYYDYPTGSNSIPTFIPSTGGTAPFTAVLGNEFGDGPADADMAGGLSPYGTMGQGGNTWEWMETASDGVNNEPGENRGRRSGYWQNGDTPAKSTFHVGTAPTENFSTMGFRIAATPEPSRLCLIALGVAGALLRRRY